MSVGTGICLWLKHNVTRTGSLRSTVVQQEGKTHSKLVTISCYLHVLVLSADKVRQQFTFIGEIDGADGAHHFTATCRKDGWTVQLCLVTHQSFARRKPLHAHWTHECRVRRLQIKPRQISSQFFTIVPASINQMNQCAKIGTEASTFLSGRLGILLELLFYINHFVFSVKFVKFA